MKTLTNTFDIYQFFPCKTRSNVTYVNTVKPPYSGHPLLRTPLYNGHFP